MNSAGQPPLPAVDLDEPRVVVGSAADARIRLPAVAARERHVEVTAEADSPGGRQARVRSAVNLRSRPADEASVLAVVPANSKVSLLGCKSWCEIVFQNRRGFVYKNFVR